MTILYIILLVMTAGLILADILGKINSWAWGLVIMVWLSVITFAGKL